MIFDLSDPKTDLKAIYLDFRDWLHHLSQQSRHVNKGWKFIEVSGISGIANGIKMDAQALEYCKFINSQIYFREEIICFWIPYYAQKHKLLNTFPLPIWFLKEESKIIFSAFKMAGFLAPPSPPVEIGIIPYYLLT